VIRSDVTCMTGAALTEELEWRPAPAGRQIDRNEVHLWRVARALSAGATDEAWVVLGDGERRRALSYRDARAARGFVVGRASLRAILGRYIGCGPADIILEEGRNGRPRLCSRERPRLHFSASRVDGMDLIAVVDGGEVGVDVERVARAGVRDSLPWPFVREQAPPGLLRDLSGLGDDPETFFVAWTRLEAYAKAFTGGLGGEPAPVPRGTAQRCHVRSFRIGADLVGSLAEGGEAPRALLAFDARSSAARRLTTTTGHGHTMG
jgi:4'-phosphopantetheinyl transferase